MRHAEASQIVVPTVIFYISSVEMDPQFAHLSVAVGRKVEESRPVPLPRVLAFVCLILWLSFYRSVELWKNEVIIFSMTFNVLAGGLGCVASLLHKH